MLENEKNLYNLSESNSIHSKEYMSMMLQLEEEAQD
mgnify:CR=1 FL=1